MTKSKTILTLVFLMAGALLTTTAVTTMVPVVYADDDHKDHDKKHDGKDGDGNKNKAEDESAAAIADCDKNDVERAGFDCFGIAINDLEIEEESNGPPG
jgi:hypothetical protein